MNTEVSEHRISLPYCSYLQERYDTQIHYLWDSRTDIDNSQNVQSDTNSNVQSSRLTSG